MNYVFPYHIVKRGSKVAIYGFGKVGRDFFEQMITLQYCECVLCVDQCFESYEKINRPFGRIHELLNVEYDYVIVAIEKCDIAKRIMEDLKVLGIDETKIVWSPDYEIVPIWPDNKRRFLEEPEFYLNITRKYRVANSIYGGGRFYQSFSEIGIAGTRNIQERLSIYNVRKYLKPTDEVLDIGCNCGFFDLQLSEYVKSVYGMDIEPLFIEIANETKEYVGNTNATFVCDDFYSSIRNADVTYDAIFALAVHTNIFVSGASHLEFVKGIIMRLKPDGLLFFESHNLLNDRARYDELCGLFLENGMEIVMHENYFSDFDRDIVILKNTNR
jgi:SAM-dependent methyltransferase